MWDIVHIDMTFRNEVDPGICCSFILRVDYHTLISTFAMIGHINSMEKQAISRAWNIEKESVGLKVRYIFEMSFIPSRVEEASSLSQVCLPTRSKPMNAPTLTSAYRQREAFARRSPGRCLLYAVKSPEQGGTGSLIFYCGRATALQRLYHH